MSNSEVKEFLKSNFPLDTEEDHEKRPSFGYMASIGINSFETGEDWKMPRSQHSDEGTKYKEENIQLKQQIKQLQQDLQAEQDSVSQVRKRLNAAEKERLESSSRSNTEIAELEGQVAKLRAQIEKGEASKQSLEFELTKYRRDLSHLTQSKAEKENALSETTRGLQKVVEDLREALHKAERQMDKEKRSHENTESKLQRQIDDREHELAKCKTEQDILRSERDKLDSVVMQQESTISDLQDKLHEMEAERKNQTENLRRTLTEIEYAKEREDRLKKDLETSLQRLRTLEESIEAERAAHLESKFNSEIVQLRVRDLEGAMEVEKSANNEANKAIDRLSKQIRELEHSYEEERKNGKELANKLDKVEREYSAVKKQLTAELENKKSVVNNLSKEIEVHQKNFSELKEELSKAKKRQIYLEETYGGSMRELELLLDNFSVSDKGKRSKTKKENKHPLPSIVLESLRSTLSEYKKRLDNTNEELSRMKKQCESMHKEVDQCKEMIWTKDKSLEDAQRNYTRTAKELNRVRSEHGELESHMARIRLELESTSSNQSKDKRRVHELSEEIMKLVKRHKAEDEEKLAYLHGMYQRMLSARVSFPTKDQGFNQFSWADLTSLVYEQVSTLVGIVQRTEEKIAHYEEAVKSKEEVIEEMQRSHEGQINKLTALTKEREASWQKQKEEIETHYAQLLNELQSRSKKSQAMADQAWEKIRMTGTVKQGLETECADLRTQVSDLQKNNTSLLAACSLLSGALFPMCSRANHLAIQRRILEDQINMWDVCKERIELLVDTLGAEMNPNQDSVKKHKRHPLFIFRAGALAVMAANRLRYMGRMCSNMFVTYDTSVCYQTGIVVCTGNSRPCMDAVFGADEEDVDLQKRHQDSQADIVHWLQSKELHGNIVNCMSELLEVVGHIKSKEKGSTVESRALVNAARNTFTKLVDKLGRHFEGVVLQPATGIRDRNSLARLTGRGLARLSLGKPLAQRQHLASMQDVLGELQNHILDFTQRLHAAELEKRNLKQELDIYKSSGSVPHRQREHAIDHEDDPQFVPMDKFESVCMELNNALRREQQAQHLLLEQGKQLEEITQQLDLYTTEGMEKEQNMTQAVQGLAELKVEVKKKEQTLRQLNRQVINMENEKKSLLTNISDAEKALRTVARDKDILSTYIRAVEKAFEQARSELSLSKDLSGREVSLSKMLLSTDFIPQDVGKAGAELIACQNLVGAFVDAQQQAFAKIRALEEEIKSHKGHITTLKKELNDAVLREYDGDMEIPTRDNGLNYKNDTFADTTQGDTFMPIKEDSEISFAVPKTATPKSKMQSRESPRKKFPSKFHTPNRMAKSSNARPSAFEPHGR